jgi:hypothetical protein
VSSPPVIVPPRVDLAVKPRPATQYSHQCRSVKRLPPDRPLSIMVLVAFSLARVCRVSCVKLTAERVPLPVLLAELVAVIEQLVRVVKYSLCDYPVRL